MKMIFDTETNGLNASKSVLSFSAVLIDDNFNIVEEIDRYYFPVEFYEMEAVNINGLTEEAIKNNRKNAIYPKHFKDDKEVAALFKRNDIEEIIAHNIPFDRRFVEYHQQISLSDKENFCTMRATQYLYDAPYFKNGEPKYPKLSEAVEWAEIDTQEIIRQTGKGYHDSLFDVYCTFELYKHLKNGNFS